MTLYLVVIPNLKCIITTFNNYIYNIHCIRFKDQLIKMVEIRTIVSITV